ncbi:4'-phosphopantetheinyl transferase superfamily protein [Providencia sp.]
MTNLKRALLSYITESLPLSIVCTLRHQQEYQSTWRLLVAMPDDIQASIQQRQNEYVRGRICAADALFQLGSGQLNVGRDKQYAPLWPAGTVGSISHNNHWVIACVAWQQEYIALGIDIETRINTDFLDAMRQYIYTQDELALLQQAGFDELTAITILFSIKESTIKSLSPQHITINKFTDIQVIQVNGSQLTIDLKQKTPHFHKRLTGRFWIHEETIVTLVIDKVN